MNMNEIKNRKQELKQLQQKAVSAKTKKTSQKYRDMAIDLRRKMAMELSEWDFCNMDFSQFNIMSVIGGPYHLAGANNFRLEKNLGSVLQVSFDADGDRWAGYIYLIEDKCGIDNLKFIV